MVVGYKGLEPRRKDSAREKSGTCVGDGRDAAHADVRFSGQHLRSVLSRGKNDPCKLLREISHLNLRSSHTISLIVSVILPEFERPSEH